MCTSSNIADTASLGTLWAPTSSCGGLLGLFTSLFAAIRHSGRVWPSHPSLAVLWGAYCKGTEGDLVWPTDWMENVRSNSMWPPSIQLILYQTVVGVVKYFKGKASFRQWPFVLQTVQPKRRLALHIFCHIFAEIIRQVYNYIFTNRYLHIYIQPQYGSKEPIHRRLLGRHLIRGFCLRFMSKA